MKAEKIARLLPEIFQATVGRGGPLDGFLAAQEALHEPAQAAIAGFAEYLDPRTAPPRFVYMLARWTDLDYLLEGPPAAPYFPGGVGRLRELVAAAARNGRERGTERALIRMLETATGCGGYRIEMDDARPFHFRLVAPYEARTFERLIRRIAAAEKPAFATCEVRFEAAPGVADGEPGVSEVRPMNDE